MIGIRCPLCGSTNLRVKMDAWVRLVQTLDRDDGIDENETSVDMSDVEISKSESVSINGDIIGCCDCQHVGKVAKFEFKKNPVGTVEITGEDVLT